MLYVRFGIRLTYVRSTRFNFRILKGSENVLFLIASSVPVTDTRLGQEVDGFV
ncbi:hypothetical protein M569_07965 [Genlisea aurea]|uniref:Uncharacterized protein n=1 Tax=Genlisea aurea TaxID=192259 RepID=S8CPM7_9LAMI|nr:hypothetical protein M569_07965 [Genlisea aurea]